MEAKTIPDPVSHNLWLLTTDVCDWAKISTKDRSELFPKLNAHLLRRWESECQSMTELEESEWEIALNTDLYHKTSQNRESWWRRLLSYDENRHGRYILVLLGSAAASYFYPEDTIIALFPPENRIAGFSEYLLLAAFAVICGSIAVSAMAVAKAKFNLPRVKKIAEQLPIVVLSAQLTLILITFHLQRGDQVIQNLNTLRVLLAIISCCIAILVACAESFPWTKRLTTHPLFVAISTGFEHVLPQMTEVDEQSVFARTAFQVCDVAQMDVGTYRNKIAREIYEILVERSQELSPPSDEMSNTYDRILARFGSIAEAGHPDGWWFRVLVYHRHEGTRYFFMISLSMAVVFFRLLTSVALEPSAHGILPHSVDRWNEDILYGGMLAICIVLAKLTHQVRSWPLRVLFGIVSIAVLLGVCVDATIALENIHRNWRESWSEGCILLCASALLVILVCVVNCAVCEFFSPLSARTQIVIRRKASQIFEMFSR